MSKIGHLGIVAGAFNDEPLLRVVKSGADFLTAKADDVIFDSRYPILSVMLSDAVLLAAGTSTTFDYPQWIVDLPFIPVVKAGGHNPNGNILAPGWWVEQPTSSNPGGGYHAANYYEVTGYAKDENDVVHPASYTGTLGVAVAPNTEHADCVMPYAHLDQYPAGKNIRGFTIDAFTDRVVFSNNYLTELSVRFHVLNMGA